MLSRIEVITHGKWILAGEHAVLRGHTAMVFPVANKKLTLTYDPSSSMLNADFSGDCGADLHLLFWSVIEQGMKLLGKSLNALHGHFNIENTIPVGVGLGVSAALCVAVSRWFLAQQFIAEHQLRSFATQLEDLFHGKSSGLDIAGVLAAQGIEFCKGQYTPLELAWNPRWYLSSCGQMGITSHCIQQVEALWEEDPELGQQIDQEMQSSVELACAALKYDTPEARGQLVQAINGAAECFQQWGLVSESLHQHMVMLRQAGACALKPTGSGGGGYVVSLWNDRLPPEQLQLTPL